MVELILKKQVCVWPCNNRKPLQCVCLKEKKNLWNELTFTPLILQHMGASWVPRLKTSFLLSPREICIWTRQLESAILLSHWHHSKSFEDLLFTPPRPYQSHCSRNLLTLQAPTRPAAFIFASPLSPFFSEELHTMLSYAFQIFSQESLFSLGSREESQQTKHGPFVCYRIAWML